jgi:hypothetical protein
MYILSLALDRLLERRDLREQELQEAAFDVAINTAATMLQVAVACLQPVTDRATIERVLDTGKQVEQQALEVASGKRVFIRVYQALGRLFAQIEQPGRAQVLYRAVEDKDAK